MVILLGAEIDAAMEHQTMRDTTTGSPKPVGTLGSANGRYHRCNARPDDVTT